MIVYHQPVTTHHLQHHDLHISINNLEEIKLSICQKGLSSFHPEEAGSGGS